MADYADISELDDKIKHIRTAWRKAVDYSATLCRGFAELEVQFKSGKYGPEWTFSRWLTLKCGMSYRTTYRIIQQLHRVASEDQREQIRQALEEERRAKAQDKADRRATQIAWNGWLAEEKQRVSATQTTWDRWVTEERYCRKATQDAWDQWSAEEKRRLNVQKEAERQAKAEERKKEAKRTRERERYRQKKAEKANVIKPEGILPNMSAENSKNENLVPNVTLLIGAIDRLISLLNLLPLDDRLTWLERISARLTAIGKRIVHEAEHGPGASGEGVGHAGFDA